MPGPRIHLYTTPPIWGLPSNSPACAKLETWLKMAGVDYDRPPTDFSKAPKGKIPFIGEGDALMGDSSLIIEHFKTTRDIDLDRELSPMQRAISLAFRRMLKENDYWVTVLIRYSIPENWQLYRETLADVLAPGQPDEERRAAAEGYKEMVMGSTHAHGLGRHDIDEVATLFAQDLEALATLLGDNTWMMGGDTPTTLDATVYGYFSNIALTPYQDALSNNAREHTELMKLCERIQARYFPELAADEASPTT